MDSNATQTQTLSEPTATVGPPLTPEQKTAKLVERIEFLEGRLADAQQKLERAYQDIADLESALDAGG